MTQEIDRLVERPVDAIARTFYEWGIGRGNDFGWNDAPKSIRDRCYHAADAALRSDALTALIKREGELAEALTDIRNRVLCPVGPQPTLEQLADIASAALTTVENRTA